MAEEILKGEINEGEIILANHDGKSDELTLKIKKKRQTKEKKKE